MTNMGIETGVLDEPSLEAGAVVAAVENAWLILDEEYVDEAELRLTEIDTDPGRVRLHYPAPADGDGVEYIDQTYDTFRTARLAFGLWQSCGPFDEPEGGAIPTEVATAGMPYIAAYLSVNANRGRESIAEQMDVTAKTVSDYWTIVRWTPEDSSSLS